MNIYEYAMKVEKDGEEYYRTLAQKSSDEGLKKIFTMLANQEVKHYNTLKRMSNNDEFCISEYETFDDEKTIYETLDQNKGRLQFPLEEIQYYEEAISHEEDMSHYYLEKASEAKTDAEKHILTAIAHEEAKHKVILEDILEYIREGDNLVGSAEF
jgi:rubrerythrin